MTTINISFDVFFLLRMVHLWRSQLSWQRWSGPSRHATWWREHTNQVKTHCSIYCPKTQYQPESKLPPSHRPEGCQSHPENKKMINREQDSTVTMFGLHAQTYFTLRPTMHEEAPEAPVQIIRSVILLPQNWRHASLVSSLLQESWGVGSCSKQTPINYTQTRLHKIDFFRETPNLSSVISSYHCSELSPSCWSHISCHQGSYLRSQPRTQVTRICWAGLANLMSRISLLTV